MLTELEQFEPTIIKLSYAYHIEPLEPCDLAQELRLWLWLKEKEQKKPIKSYKNWAYIVCRNKIRDLAKYHQSQKRDYKKVSSLDELIEKGFDIEQ